MLKVETSSQLFYSRLYQLKDVRGEYCRLFCYCNDRKRVTPQMVNLCPIKLYCVTTVSISRYKTIKWKDDPGTHRRHQYKLPISLVDTRSVETSSCIGCERCVTEVQTLSFLVRCIKVRCIIDALRFEMQSKFVYDDLSCNASQTFRKERLGADSKAKSEAKLNKILRCVMTSS